MSMNRLRFPLRFFGPLVLLLVSCTTGPAFLPESYLREIASSQFQQMKQESQVSGNPEHNDRVQRVGRRIAEAAGVDIAAGGWEFVVFEDPAANAFAMPGGKIGVNTGLLALVSSDDELAAVMGHEVAHVMLEHANQRMSGALMVTLGQTAAAYGTREMDAGDRQLLLGALGVGAQYGYLLPFSRAHESQADEEGLLIAARAGYDPRAAISFWEKMASQGGDQPPEYLSTHPSHGRRIEDLQSAMPDALAVYREHS